MRILVVEDDIVNRAKLAKLIEKLGHEPVVAKDGVEGWQQWKSERTRVVLTDWMMPGMDGVDLCRKIRESEGSQYTYIIMITSKESTEDLVMSMDSGADDFIIKPFIKEELAVRIRAGVRIIDFETRDLVIFAMARLAESRDLETGNHLDRIRHYSKTLAKTLADKYDLDSEVDNLFIENIFLTSPLHDIGKIGIPDHVLLKSERLDSAEFEIMKQHTLIGYETLSEALKKQPKAEYLQMSAEIALSHHERFDGTGYPNGLKGDQIPIAARIVAIADVYDALVTRRRYKAAYTQDVARSIIIQEKGSHFDPRLVESYLKSEDAFVEIYDSLKEPAEA